MLYTSPMFRIGSILALWFAANAASQTVLELSKFGAHSGDGSDTTPAVRAALDRRRSAGGMRIVFPEGTYDFWPERAAEQYIYASNNDPGLKRIAFLLNGMENIEIDGQGSKSIFHGDMNVMVLDHARNVTLKNFSIDWKRPFHNEVRVTAVRDDGLDVEISDQFPYRVNKGLLYFLGEEASSCGIRNRDACPVGGLLEFDPQKRETAYMVRDFYYSPYIQASTIGPGKVHIVEPGFKATPGNTVVFGATNRNHPAITVSD